MAAHPNAGIVTALPHAPPPRHCISYPDRFYLFFYCLSIPIPLAYNSLSILGSRIHTEWYSFHPVKYYHKLIFATNMIYFCIGNIKNFTKCISWNHGMFCSSSLWNVLCAHFRICICKRTCSTWNLSSWTELVCHFPRSLAAGLSVVGHVYTRLLFDRDWEHVLHFLLIYLWIL